jgi:hypothetical protein
MRPPPLLKKELHVKALLVVVLLLVQMTISGCLLEPLPPAAKSAHTRSLETWYPDKGAQALAVAAEFGDAAEVRRLMKEEGVDPDKHFSPEGMPLLAWPIFTQNPVGLKAMLENGADPNAALPYPVSPDRPARNNDNALVWAAKQEDPIYLRHLLDHGGDPNTRNVNNETLLFQAYIWQDQWQNVQLLVERGADVNAITGIGTILHNYSGRGAFKKAYWLLQKGADPNPRNFLPPSQSHRSLILESIFWKPMDPGEGREWQIKCQQWVLSKGFKRPPLPDHYRRDREAFGFETDESKVPLPELNEGNP